MATPPHAVEGEADLDVFEDNLERARIDILCDRPREAHENLSQRLYFLSLARQASKTGTDARIERLYARTLYLFGRLLLSHHENDESALETLRESAARFEYLLASEFKPAAEDLESYGIALFLSGKVEKAGDVLGRARIIDPNNPEVLFYFGLLFQKRGECRPAIECLERALALRHPNRATVSTAIARTHLAEYEARQNVKNLNAACAAFRQAAVFHAGTGHLEQALEILQEALRHIPGELALLAFCAELQRRLKKYAKAIELANGVLSRVPEHALAMATKGAALIEGASASRDEKSINEGIQYLDRCLDQSADNVFALEMKAAGLAVLKRHAEAVSLLDEALLRAPQSVFPLTLQTEALRLERKYDEAFETVEEALRLSPLDVVLIGTKGQLLHALGRDAEAIFFLNRAIASDPTLDWVYAELGDIALNQGRAEDAISHLEDALDLNEQNAHAWIRLAEAQIQLDQLEDGLESIERALNAPDAPDNALVLKGKLLHKLHRSSEALEAFNAALDKQPDSVEILNGKAQTLQRLGEYDAALHIVTRLLPNAPEPLAASLSMTKGWCHLRLGDYHQAQLAVASQAAAGSPRAALIKTHALLALDFSNEALATIRQAVEIDGGNAELLAVKAYILNKIRPDEENFKLFDQASGIDDRLTWTYIYRAEGCHVLGMDAEADRYCSRAQALIDDDFAAGAALANLQIERKKYAAAAQVLKANLNPRNLQAVLALGLVHGREGREGEARHAIQLARQLNAHAEWPYINLPLRLHRAGFSEDAWAESNSLLKKSAARPNALIVQGIMLSDVGEFERAAKTFEESIALHSENPWRWYRLGWAYENLGVSHAKKSYEAYKQAYDLSSRHDCTSPFYLKGLANSYSLLGDQITAASYYSQAIDLARSGYIDSFSLALLGWCHYNLGDYDEAMRLFTSGLALLGKYASVQFDLGLTLLCSRRLELGKEAYQRGLGWVRADQQPRFRGVLAVAQNDLEEAMQRMPELKKKAEATESLEEIHSVLADLRNKPISWLDQQD